MLIERYQQKIRTLSDVKIKYDRTEIKQLNHDATKLLATLLANSIQAPNPYPPPLHTPSHSLKMNKLDLPTWSSETYDLYSWLTSCETMFASAETGPIVRAHTMKQAMPEK